MNDQSASDITKLIKIIGKFKILIVFGTIFCVLSAVVATIYSRPVYQSTAKLLVSPKQTIQTGYSVGSEAMSLASLSERMVKTYSKMLESRSIAEKVIEKLNLYESPINLSNRIEAKPVIETQLIEISIKDQNPKMAMSIVNAYGEILADEVKDLENTSRKTEDSKNKNDNPLISIRLIEPAIEPDNPVSPKPALNIVMALILGFSVSTGFSFLIDYFDVTFKNVEELKLALRLPVLGQIPVTEIDEDQNVKVITKINPRSIPSEAFAALRTNIQFLNHDKTVKKILITSPNPKEGKSTVASNIAFSLSQTGSKVALIDCDLRRPSISKLFGLDKPEGLTNYLSGILDFKSIVDKIDENLSLIASGPIPPNPSELLNTEKMKNLLAELEKSSDYIIIDSPPLLAVTDAAIISPLVDIVLLVVSSKSTSRQTAIQAKSVLENINSKTAGVIFNNTSNKYLNSYNGYYYAENAKTSKTMV